LFAQRFSHADRHGFFVLSPQGFAIPGGWFFTLAEEKQAEDLS
jgi:hypothetical protein